MDIQIGKGIKLHLLRYLFSFILLPLISMTFSFITLYIYQSGLDYAVDNISQFTIYVVIGILVYIFLNACLTALSEYYQNDYNSIRVMELRNELSFHVKNASLFDLSKIQADKLVQIQQNISKVAGLESKISVIAINILLIIGFGLYAVIFIDWRALFIIFGSMLCLLLFQSIVSPLQNKYQLIYDKQSYSISFMEQIVKGIEITKNYKMKDVINKRYSIITNELANAERKANDLIVVIKLTQHVGILVITAIITFLATMLYKYGSITAGATVICTLLSVMFVQAFGKLLSNMQEMTEQKAAKQQLLFVANIPHKQTNKNIITKCNASLKLQNIMYYYNKKQDKPTINIPELNINPTGLYVIVGATGSGKTTLLKLIAGLLTIQEGTIRLGDTVLNNGDLNTLCAYSEQLPTFFPVSVYDNIAYAQLKPNKENINKICKPYSKLFENDVMAWDKLISENDSNLSGGQRQVISLCRALAKQSPIIILDEPIASQDKSIQKISCDIIQQYAQTHLVIVSTHNLVFAKKADEIWIIQDGEITQTGIHDILYRENEQYKILCDNEME